MTDLVHTIATTLNAPTKADQLHALSTRYRETLAQLANECESLAHEFEAIISDRLDEIVSTANEVREEIREIIAEVRAEVDEQIDAHPDNLHWSDFQDVLESADIEMETECEPTVDVSIDDAIDMDVFDNLETIIQHLRDEP